MTDTQHALIHVWLSLKVIRNDFLSGQLFLCSCYMEHDLSVYLFLISFLIIFVRVIWTFNITMYVMILLDVKKLRKIFKNIIDESYTADLPLLTIIINFMLKNVIKKLEIACLYIAMKTIQILKNVTNWKWLKFIGTSVTTSTLAITRGSKATMLTSATISLTLIK